MRRGVFALDFSWLVIKKMKRLLPILLGVFGTCFAYGQSIIDSISLGQGYAHQAYYSLSDGEVSNVDNTNWDIAFDMSGFGSTLRRNGSQGVEVYVYPNQDSSGWGSQLDTTGISGWRQLYDSDTSWANGAFSSTANSGDPFDLGWGVYNPTTHHVNGDSIFLVKLANGTLKQLHLIKLASSEYTFRHANLDGSNPVNSSISKSDYTGKNFVYYSLGNDQVIDREPANDTWDLVFSGYVGEVFPGTWYGVTGVLQNVGVTAAKAHPVNDPGTYVDYAAHILQSEMNTIGYDWKTFDLVTYSYLIEDSLAYFVQDLDGSIWRVVCTGFSGSTSGNFYFEKELITTVDIEAAAVAKTFGMYPNPVPNAEVTLTFELAEGEADLAIFDLNGTVVRSQKLVGHGFQKKTISLNGLAKGIYMVSLSARGAKIHRKLIIQ